MAGEVVVDAAVVFVEAVVAVVARSAASSDFDSDDSQTRMDPVCF